MTERQVPRVLFVLNHAGAGGTERYIETLVSGLVPQRMAAMLAYNETGPLVGRLAALGVTCRQTPLRSRFDLRAAREIARIAEEFGADIIHCMFLREHYLVWLARLFGLKAQPMATVHLMLDQASSPPLLWLDKAVYRGMGAILTVCEKLGEQMRAAYGLSGTRVRTVPNGVVPVRRDPDNAAVDRERVRRELGIPKDAVLFLTAGRFSEEKGYGFLLDGIRVWRQKHHPDEAQLAAVRFVLAGEGPLWDAFAETLRQEGFDKLVLLAGYRRDLPALLQAADVYLSPSRTEAMSLSILEAMAAGLPVLATDVGGTPELVRREWENGLLVPYGEAGALADGIAMFLCGASARCDMGVKAAAAVAAHFTRALMLDRTVAVYEQLAGCVGTSDRIE